MVYELFMNKIIFFCEHLKNLSGNTDHGLGEKIVHLKKVTG